MKRRVHEQDRMSLRDQELARWTSATPTRSARVLSREEIQREYGGRLQEMADRRLAKEFAAYDKLDAINQAWERRGRGPLR